MPMPESASFRLIGSFLFGVSATWVARLKDPPRPRRSVCVAVPWLRARQGGASSVCTLGCTNLRRWPGLSRILPYIARIARIARIAHIVAQLPARVFRVRHRARPSGPCQGGRHGLRHVRRRRHGLYVWWRKSAPLRSAALTGRRVPPCSRAPARPPAVTRAVSQHRLPRPCRWYSMSP